MKLRIAIITLTLSACATNANYKPINGLCGTSYRDRVDGVWVYCPAPKKVKQQARPELEEQPEQEPWLEQELVEQEVEYLMLPDTFLDKQLLD